MSEWKEWSKHVILELNRLGTEVRGLRDTQDEMNTHMSQYNLELQRHIAGVEALEDRTDIMKTQQVAFKTEALKRLKTAELPVQWVQSTAKILKFVAIIAAGIGALYGLAKLFMG